MKSNPSLFDIKRIRLLTTLSAALLILVPNVHATDLDQFEEGKHAIEERSVVYRMFRPEIAADSERTYPLIVFLHGSGERGDDNKSQIVHNFPDVFLSDEEQTRNPCFILAPQCPEGFSWKESTIHCVKSLIDSLCDELPIDTNRLYLTGLSMGGRGVFNFLSEYPGFFAAAVPCAGGSDASLIGKMRQTPMWMHCASNDKSIKYYHALVEALEKEGDHVISFKDNRKLTAANMPWEKVEKGVEQGESFLFCEVLEGYHQDSWLFAWENPQMPVWLFSKKKQ